MRKWYYIFVFYVVHLWPYPYYIINNIHQSKKRKIFIEQNLNQIYTLNFTQKNTKTIVLSVPNIDIRHLIRNNEIR